MTNQYFDKIDISHHCKEQDFGICAIHLVTKTPHLIILSLCRAPLGVVNEFLRRLDTTLKYLCNPKFMFIICGDININYLNQCSQKKTSKLFTGDIQSVTQAKFATRVQNSSSTAIGNIFIDSARLSS
jgi:hypothetical protein